MSNLNLNTISSLDTGREVDVNRVMQTVDYVGGLVIDSRDTIIVDGDNRYVLAASTVLPYTTTGAGMPEGGAFVAVGDSTLRQDLTNPDKGGGLVGVSTSTGEQTLAEALDNRVNAVNVKMFGAVGDGSTDDSAAIKAAESFSDGRGSLFFPSGEYRMEDHVVIRSNIIVSPGATFSLDWTETSWLTLYCDVDVLPEWFGATPQSVSTDETELRASRNAAGIQAALDTAIDISINPIGVVPDTNHGQYNSVTVMLDGGKTYYIGTNTIRIRSEHHFLGVRITARSPSYFGGGIKGDGSGTGIKIEKAEHPQDIGAQTNKDINGIGIRTFARGIHIERADQSNYVRNCRFVQISGECIWGIKQDNLQILNNTFNSNAGGWFVYLIGANLCQVTGNVTGEAVSESAGIYMDIGGARGGNLIANNTFRGGQIYVDSASSTTKAVLIEGNTLINCKAKLGTAAIHVTNNARNAVVSDNIIEGTDNIQGIRFFNGHISGNNVKDFTQGIFCGGLGLVTNNTVVNCSQEGIRADRGKTGDIEATFSNNLIVNALVGIYVERSKTHQCSIIFNNFKNCTTGLTGSSDFQRALTLGNVFDGCATVESIFKPTSNRQHDRVLLENAYSSTDAESYKLRSGANRNANVIGTYSSIPVAGTWKQGDIVWNTNPSAGGVVGWVCVDTGTPGTWQSFGAIST